MSPQGEPEAGGTRDDPLDSISDAVRLAEPGETVQVSSGEYRENMYLGDGGAPGAPITITGPRDAVVRPRIGDGGPIKDGAPILRFRASHVHLRGMTFDGLADPAHEGEADWYADVISVSPKEEENYLEDLVIMPDAIGNGRSALINTMRITDAEIGEFEVIGPAGAQHLYGDMDGHVGEVVYLGTALDNLAEDWYEWDTIDETRNVHVHHIDNSAGHPHAELVDAKPGTRDIVIEYCSDLGGSGAYTLQGHPEDDEAAIGLLGMDSTLRYSIISNGNGNAVEIGSWDAAHPNRFAEVTGMEFPDTAVDAGTGNAIYHNRFTDNAGLTIYFPMEDGNIVPGLGPDAQRVICGNEMTGETHGDPEQPCPSDVPRTDEIGHTGG